MCRPWVRAGLRCFDQLASRECTAAAAVQMDSVFESQAADNSLRAWILQESLPSVGELTTDTFPMYAGRNLPMFILFLNVK